MNKYSVRACLSALLLPFLFSCGGLGGILDVDRLARFPPMPYRLAVGGGAILRVEERLSSGEEKKISSAGYDIILPKTFREGDAEPISFKSVEQVLRDGRAASSFVLLDPDDFLARESLAFEEGVSSEPAVTARESAAKAGADLLLVLEGLSDAPLVQQGVTGSWPVTTIAWLIAGLGMFIPDHRFESEARLALSIRDVYTGKKLYSFGVTAGTVDLSMFERTDFLGVIESLIIPPPLVGNDKENVGIEVRKEIKRRLLLKMLARLKDPETIEEIRKALPFRLVLAEQRGGAVLVTVTSAQEIQALVVEVDGKALEGPIVEAFMRQFFASQQPDSRAELINYQASLDLEGKGRELRVIVQDSAGQRVSGTSATGGQR